MTRVGRGGPARALAGLGRDRLILLAGVGGATALCWLYTVDAATRPHSGGHATGHPALALGMWAIMMAGMMLPAASPMIVTYAAVSRREAKGHLARTALFVFSYLVVWSGVSAAGATAQWGLASASLLSSAGASASPLLSGCVLIGAAVYQLSPLKHACLHRCRTPLGFLLTEWRPGPAGALRLGALHGAECVLCCWALMALMLVVGVMDLRWMGALTAFMLAEKALPGGHRIARVSAIGLLAWGTWCLAQSAMT